ncbi:MAG: GNAT family N-acetyltransferase [Acidobacteriia bacterium]|nr:GNAT family N-acetyltransferase [Terriglobia bacterium]
MSLAVHTVTGKEEERVFALVTQVSSSYMALQENRLNFSELHESIMQLEEFICSNGQDEAKTGALLGRLDPEMIDTVNHAYRFWRIQLEHDFARRLSKGEASLSDYPLNSQFAGLIERELALVSGQRPERILFIGNGPLPISAIHLHLQTGVPVDCLLRDPGAVPLARDVIASCATARGVRVLHEEEAQHDVSGYDLVIVGLLTKQKKTILKMLRKNCRPGCRILCRTSHGLWRLVHETVSDRDLRGFHRKGRQVTENGQAGSTWLLEAASSAAADVQMEWLREVDSNRASQLLRLMNRTLEEETTIGFPGPIDDETGRALMRQLNEDVTSGHRHVLVAYKDGAIVGQLILTPNSSPNHRHIVELTRGTIDPSFRGGGLALRAFQEIARKCEELGREVICLDVRAGTHAAIWWQHFGFKQYGLLSDYSRVGDKRYQGLYLTQTTAELKQRLRELARMARDPQPQLPDAGPISEISRNQNGF